MVYLEDGQSYITTTQSDISSEEQDVQIWLKDLLGIFIKPDVLMFDFFASNGIFQAHSDKVRSYSTPSFDS